MAIIIFPGKGGTGKTTLSALSIKYFMEKNEVSLALDLDPDAHLNKLLGVQVNNTLGDIVDHIHKEKKAELEPQKPVDISDQEYFLSLVVQDALVEGEEFDLLTLGKPSADIDCYCPSFLWSEYAIPQIMKSYGLTYDDVVVDCDPGTEIFPRKILEKIASKVGIDHMMIALDGSVMSLDTARDIINETKKMEVEVRNIIGVVNRVDDVETQNRVKETAEDEYGFKVAGFIPTDPEIIEMGLTGKNIFELKESKAYQVLRKIMKTLNI